MRAGHWDKQNYRGFELGESTLSVMGCGAIGSRMTRFALALGVRVAVTDPYLGQAQLPEEAVKGWPRVLRRTFSTCCVRPPWLEAIRTNRHQAPADLAALTTRSRSQTCPASCS